VRNPVYTSIAIGVGIVVLLGYFLQIDLLVNLRIVFLKWATILVAVALLVGIVNLFVIHFRKSAAEEPNRIYSIVLIGSMTITLLVAGWFGPTHTYSLWIFNYIQIPIEASLMAILTVVLIYAGIRLLRRKPDLLTIVFVATAVVILLMSGALFGIDIPGLSELRIWIGKVPAVAGARGILWALIVLMGDPSGTNLLPIMWETQSCRQQVL
jgi:hypothetical protein